MTGTKKVPRRIGAFLFGVIVIAFLAGCGDTTPEITTSYAKAKLHDLSQGLDVRYDDMKDAVICRCNAELDDKLFFIPRVELDNQFKPKLYLQAFHISSSLSYFNKLYVRSANKTLNLDANTNEYNSAMSIDVYEVLEDGVASGYIKVRLEGRDMDERELTSEEITQIANVLKIYDYFSKVKVVIKSS